MTRKLIPDEEQIRWIAPKFITVHVTWQKLTYRVLTFKSLVISIQTGKIGVHVDMESEKGKEIAAIALSKLRAGAPR